MTPAERVEEAFDRLRDEQRHRDRERLAEDRRGMSPDCFVCRWDVPEKEPWIA